MPDFTSRRKFLKTGSAVGRRAGVPRRGALRIVRPDAGPFQEYKGRDETLPVSSDTSTLSCVNGIPKVPSGPGLGVRIDPAFVAKGGLIR